MKDYGGHIKDLKKNYILTRESADGFISYWQRIRDTLDRCEIQPEDSPETAICKAYISASGRETNACERLRAAGITIWPHDGNIYDTLLRTIWPDDTRQDTAREHVLDVDLLELARELGKMRNP